MIKHITNISQFDVNNGVDHSYTQFNTTSPSFMLDPATWWLKDNEQFHNEALKVHIRMDDVESTNFKIMFGCTSAGAGRALQFDFSATNKWVRLVNTSGIDQVYDSVIEEVDMHSRRPFTDALFVSLKIIISNNKLKCWFGNYFLFDIETFSISGTYWGACNLTGSTRVYTGDVTAYSDQVLWGNVNLNGEPDDLGQVIVYNQDTYQVIDYTYCDSNGEYMVFLDDDPADMNKYFLYGFIPGIVYVQPRGVSNITL